MTDNDIHHDPAVPPANAEPVAAPAADPVVRKPLQARLGRFALLLAVLLPLWFAAAAIGSKIGLWNWQFGLGTMTIGWGPWVLTAVSILAIIALLWALIKKPRGNWIVPLIALAIPVGAFVFLAGVRDKAGDNPIHDVTTNPADPPMFSAELLAEREAEDANPINVYDRALDGMDGKTLQGINAELYADMEPLVTAASPREVADVVAGVFAAQGLKDVTTDLAEGRVEGTDETFWYGFKDDVVARIRSVEGAGSVIDLRSVSRVGQSDLGKNAERVRELRVAIDGKLNS